MAHADLISTETLTDPQPLVIAGHEFRSRLMVGTGKYASNAQMIDAIDASGAEVVTVAVRRPSQFRLARTSAQFYSAHQFQTRFSSEWNGGVIACQSIVIRNPECFDALVNS